MGSLIAGFDAGQTHTRCRLALLLESGALQPLGQGEGPGVSHLDAAGGEQRFQQALQQSLAAALLQARTPAEPLQAAAVGASGIETGSMVQSRAQQLAAAALQLPADRLSVSGDERTALEGARGACSEGILLISGTGCIALGRNSTGHEHRCGGWGWLLDGAGSAMDIGRDGLALSLQMADGRQPERPLRRVLWQALGLDANAVTAPQAIKSLVVQPGFGAAGFASLAPLVHAEALAGDPDARAIVQRSAAALAQMAAAVARQLQLENPPIWSCGGAIENMTLLRQELAAALQQQLPGAVLAVPAGDGCDGALSLARALLRPR